MIDVEKFDYIDDVQGYINKCTHSGQNEFIDRIDEHINNLNNCFRGLELSVFAKSHKASFPAPETA